MAIRWRQESPEDLQAAIRFTAETTGFVPRLIEKDYFCSVILEALAAAVTPLIQFRITISRFSRFVQDLVIFRLFGQTYQKC